MSNKRNKQATHELQYNVSQLLKEVTGATRRYEINNTALSKIDKDVSLVSPLVGWVKFLRTGSDILVTGLLTTTIKKPCGRCLTAFTGSASIDL